MNFEAFVVFVAVAEDNARWGGIATRKSQRPLRDPRGNRGTSENLVRNSIQQERGIPRGRATPAAGPDD